MKTKFTIMVALLGIFAMARADILLLLDERGYETPRAIEYTFSTGVFDVEIEEGIDCSGDAASQPAEGLNLRFIDKYYALEGDVVLDFSSNPVKLVMSSGSGELVCTLDRIFRDPFAMR